MRSQRNWQLCRVVGCQRATTVTAATVLRTRAGFSGESSNRASLRIAVDESPGPCTAANPHCSLQKQPTDPGIERLRPGTEPHAALGVPPSCADTANGHVSGTDWSAGSACGATTAKPRNLRKFRGSVEEFGFGRGLTRHSVSEWSLIRVDRKLHPHSARTTDAAWAAHFRRRRFNGEKTSCTAHFLAAA